MDAETSDEGLDSIEGSVDAETSDEGLDSIEGSVVVTETSAVGAAAVTSKYGTRVPIKNPGSPYLQLSFG